MANAGEMEGKRPIHRGRPGRVVVLVAGLPLLAAACSPSTGPAKAPALPWAPTSVTAVAGGGLVVAQALAEAVSPISFPGMEQQPELSWTLNGAELSVMWGPGQGGAVPSGSPPPQWAHASAGFTVSGAEEIVSPGAARVTPLAGGRAGATLSVLPDGQPPSDDSGVEADRWVTWRLADGRYARVWKAGARSDQLEALAATFADTPYTFPAVMKVGLAPEGDAPVAAAKVGNPQSLQFASTTLCPPGAAPDAPGGGHVTAPSCVLVTVFDATNLLQFGMGSREQKITAGGLEVHVFPDDHSGYAKMNDRLAVTALGPPDLTDEQVSAIIASVQFDPALANRAWTIARSAAAEAPGVSAPG